MSAADPRGAQAKLAAARTRLVVDKPFIGVLLLHLPFEAASWCESVATDARRIYYSEDYVARLTLRQTQFVLAHQALHCALGHFARRGHRIRARWDAACDYAVNLLLVEEGLEPVAGALVDPVLTGLSAEEIYPLLGEEAARRSFDTHLFDAADVGGQTPVSGRKLGSVPAFTEELDTDAAVESGADALGSDAAPQRRHNPGIGGGEPPATRVEPDELERRWQTRFAMAAQQARHAGRLGASWQRVLSVALQPPLPWRALLARFVSSCAHEDYTFQRPPRRESQMILPRLTSDVIELHAVLDTSGSIGDAELDAFGAEIDALKGQVRARVSVHACDCALAPDGPWVFEPWQPIVLPDRLPGGGGTDFRPVFEWLQENVVRPDLVLYFTDAQGEFPNCAPPYPVAWLVKGNAPVPWGERIGFS